MDILVFDTQGHRHVLRGRQGQTLADLLADNESILGDGEALSPCQYHDLTVPIWNQMHSQALKEAEALPSILVQRLLGW